MKWCTCPPQNYMLVILNEKGPSWQVREEMRPGGVGGGHGFHVACQSFPTPTRTRNHPAGFFCSSGTVRIRSGALRVWGLGHRSRQRPLHPPVGRGSLGGDATHAHDGLDELLRLLPDP